MQIVSEKSANNDCLMICRHI